MDSFGSIGSEIDGFAADVRMTAAELFGNYPVFLRLQTKIDTRLELVITPTAVLAQPFVRAPLTFDGSSLWLLVSCVGHGANWFNVLAFNAPDAIASKLGLQSQDAEAVGDFLTRLRAEITQTKGEAA